MPHFVCCVAPVQKESLSKKKTKKTTTDENSQLKIKRQNYSTLDTLPKSGGLKSKILVSRKVRPLSRMMAPFKLFRMGQGSASRSTSQENPDHQSDPSTPANLVITTTQNSNKLTTVMTSSAHYLNIDESETSENSSLMSLNSDQRALLSTGSTIDQIGYSSPQLTEIPISPPPSYESVMKENQLLALDKENNSIQTTIHTNLLVDHNFYQTSHGSNNNLLSEMNEFSTINNSSTIRENLLIDGNECEMDQCNGTACNCINNEDENDGNYAEYDDRCLENEFAERCNLNDSTADNHHHNLHQSNECINCPDEYSNECQNQYHHQDIDYNDQYYNEDDAVGQQHQQQQMSYPVENNRGPEILYKSSKQLYKAVARQCGIQCKMTDTCRCVDCQSRYFDCEFDQNENEKTDGGLGAGTPMFVNEVLHGTACTIL